MLSFEHKKAIFGSFNELVEKSISNDRLDFIYPRSLQRGKILATQLHPSGNGYVIGKYMDSELVTAKGYKVDNQGWIKVKDFSVEELHDVIKHAIMSMSNKEITNYHNAKSKETNQINSNAENIGSKTISEKVSFDLVQFGLLALKKVEQRSGEIKRKHLNKVYNYVRIIRLKWIFVTFGKNCTIFL